MATDHDEVSFYFALAFSVSHLGTFLAFFIEPAVAKASSHGSVCLRGLSRLDGDRSIKSSRQPSVLHTHKSQQ